MSLSPSTSSSSIVELQHEASLKKILKKIRKTNDNGKELAKAVIEAIKSGNPHNIEPTVQKIIQYQTSASQTADACKCYPLLRHLEYYGEVLNPFVKANGLSVAISLLKNEKETGNVKKIIKYLNHMIKQDIHRYAHAETFFQLRGVEAILSALENAEPPVASVAISFLHHIIALEGQKDKYLQELFELGGVEQLLLLLLESNDDDVIWHLFKLFGDFVKIPKITATLLELNFVSRIIQALRDAHDMKQLKLMKLLYNFCKEDDSALRQLEQDKFLEDVLLNTFEHAATKSHRNAVLKIESLLNKKQPGKRFHVTPFSVSEPKPQKSPSRMKTFIRRASTIFIPRGQDSAWKGEFETGLDLSKAGDYESAIHHLRKSLLAAASNEEKMLSHSVLAESLSIFQNHEPTVAFGEIKSALHYLNHSKDETSICNAKLFIGLAYAHLRDKQAIEYLQDVVHATHKHGEMHQHEILALYGLSEAHQHKKDFEEALKYDERALELVEKSAHTTQQMYRALYNLSQTQLAAAFPEKSLGTTRKLETFLETHDDVPDMKVNMLQLIAEAHLQLHHIRDAKSYLLESLSLMLEQPSKDSDKGKEAICKCHEKLAKVYQKMAQHNQSVQHLYCILELSENNPALHLLNAKALVELANVIAFSGNMALSREIIQKLVTEEDSSTIKKQTALQFAYEIYQRVLRESPADSGVTLACLEGLGSVCEMMGETETAINCFEMALDVATKNHVLESNINSLLSLARLKMKDDYVMRALELSCHSKHNQQQAALEFSELAALKQDWKKTLILLGKAVSLLPQTRFAKLDLDNLLLQKRYVESKDTVFKLLQLANARQGNKEEALVISENHRVDNLPIRFRKGHHLAEWQNVSQLKKRLAEEKDTVFVEFSFVRGWSENSLFIWIIRAGEVEFIEKKLDSLNDLSDDDRDLPLSKGKRSESDSKSVAELASLFDEFVQLLDHLKPQEAAELSKPTFGFLQELDELLVQIGHTILPSEKLKCEKLVILPDGILSYLPFQAIIDLQQVSVNSAKPKCIVAPSILHYLMHSADNTDDGSIEHKATVIADPEGISKEAQEEASLICNITAAPYQFHQLKAKKDHIISAMQQSTILHVTAQISASGIVLASENGETVTLTPQEISQLDLRNLKLVIIDSGCRNYFVDIAPDFNLDLQTPFLGSFSSVPFGFYAAGAKHVVYSLWNTDKRFTLVYSAKLLTRYLAPNNHNDNCWDFPELVNAVVNDISRASTHGIVRAASTLQIRFGSGADNDDEKVRREIMANTKLFRSVYYKGCFQVM